jgi:hypothetical protein
MVKVRKPSTWKALRNAIANVCRRLEEGSLEPDKARVLCAGYRQIAEVLHLERGRDLQLAAVTDEEMLAEVRRRGAAARKEQEARKAALQEATSQEDN